MAEVVTTAAAAGKPPSIEEHVARLRAAFVRALTEDDLLTIARKLIDQAREGNATSARLVLKYGLDRVQVFADTERVLQEAARKASEPSPEERMARVYQRMAEQKALEEEVRRGVRPGASPRPASPAPNGKGTPPGGAAR